MRRLAVSVISVLCLATSAVAAPANPDADRAEIARVIDDSIGWFKAKDFDRMYAAFAHDAEFFIYHPDSKSTIRGFEAFREHSKVFENPDFTYGGHEVNDLSIHLSRAGETAWFSALLKDCWNYKGEHGCWEDCRWTGVLEKREGRWVITQMHFSFAEDKVREEAAEAEGEDDPEARVFGTYEDMRGVVVELFGREDYAGAAAILAGAIPRYPDHVMANTFNLALAFAMEGNGEEAALALEDGFRRGIFYSKWAFDRAPWDSLVVCEPLRRAVARNGELIAAAQASAEMKLEVTTPAGYSADRRYPLFIALHGGGENLEQFRPHWTSPRLRDEFIVAFVQSSQVAGMDGYHWQDDPITHRELAEAYREVLAAYPVDESRVYIGGFSSGGYGTLIETFDGTVPAAGFIILCPEVPGDPTAEALGRAKERGVRGTLLTTERDRRIKRQEEYVAGLTAQGMDVRFVVTPNIGHWYPDNLEDLIDEALEHIVAKP